MSINENDVFAAVLAHMATLGYGTSADDRSLVDFGSEPRPFCFITEPVTVREPLDDAQTTDTLTFVLNLWEEPQKRGEIIADIQAFVALLEGDTTLAGVCDLCQASDANQVTGQDIEGVMSYWRLNATAVFAS